MENKKYFIKTLLLALIVTPLLGNVAAIVMLSENWVKILISIPACVLLVMWNEYVKRTQLPDGFISRYLPIFLAFFYYMGAWAIAFGLADYSFESQVWGSFFTFTIPYFFINLLFVFSGNWDKFPMIQTGLFGFVLLVFSVSARLHGKRLKSMKGIFLLAMLGVFLVLVSGYQHLERQTKFLTLDRDVTQVADDFNIDQYRPFTENSKLQLLTETPALAINADYPKLDGATAAYPVYAAMAQALYQGIDPKTVNKYVECTTTSKAYERLINGETDIFFGAQPSKQQLEAAKAKGVEFTLTPIAKEAFVFFVHKENPVAGLTVEQIQAIYAKRISNWRDVSGRNEKIIAFQRPENSGSQTIMLAKVMNGKEMAVPLREEYAAGMGGVISKVAVYRNYSSAVGYSFRYFATGMNPNEDIKLLAIDGVEPSIENIRSGKYPFTVDVYAVTTGTKNDNVMRLIGWILSEQGQRFIEKCGYVSR